MSDLESALHRLSTEAAPPSIALIEARILGRVAGHSFRREPLRVRAAAVALALTLGVAGGLMPDSEHHFDKASSILGEAVELAPSTLLTAAS